MALSQTRVSGDVAAGLVDRVLAGDRLALARLMTLVENRHPELPGVMSRLSARTGRAHVVGVTGPPGAGKSTLVDALIGRLRTGGRRIGVVAVDPSSPFSGGAVLGDRIRMQAHFLDPGVFIRSLATRGSHGGLPRAARDVVRLLDAFGMDVVLVETVGVGQTELDVMRLADSDRGGPRSGGGRHGAGDEGGPARDRRRLRGEQGGPRRRGADGVGARADAASAAAVAVDDPGAADDGVDRQRGRRGARRARTASGVRGHRRRAGRTRRQRGERAS